MLNNLRTIAPSNLRPQDDPAVPPDPQPRLKRKRQNTRAACTPCRTRKCACDGQRPTCGQCGKKALECTWVTADADETYTSALKRQLTHLEALLQKHTDFLQRLQSVPEEDAVALLRQLKSTAQPSDVLSSLEGSMHARLRPSDNLTTRGLLPPTDSAFEVELIMRHNVAYPVLVPIDVSSISVAALFRRNELGISSLPRAASGLLKTPNGSDSSRATAVTPNAISHVSPRALLASQVKSEVAESPLPTTSNHVDARLDRLEISYWTKVPISDGLAASIISCYLEVDHPLFGFFDPDLFLDDLVGHRLDFCSPCLVSALLYYACQLYTAVDIQAATFCQAFFTETDPLIKAERSADSLCAAAALQLFSVGCINQGRAKLGQQLLVEGCRMAERLRLFGVPHSEPNLAYFRKMSAEQKKAAAYTAWGIHNWLTEEAIAYPPISLIPGLANEEALNFRSNLDWPLHPLPGFMGQTFTALCKIWSIAREIATVYFDSPETDLAQRVPLAFVELKYQSLLECMNKLGPDMGDYCVPHVLLFHIQFHFLVLTILLPILESSGQFRLPSFSSGDSTPQAAFTASMNQMKRLILRYRLDHAHAICSTHANFGLLQVSNAKPTVLHDSDWRFYFSLCLNYYQDLYVRYPVYKDVLQGFLAKAMDEEMLSSREASAFMNSMRKIGAHHEALHQATALFTIDFNMAMTEPDKAQANALARKFDELAIFYEVTEGDYVNPQRDAA
ncbi:Notoamide biosynthesis transcriptional activator notL' [Paramyrothecium foliicola]|nr:Notoamide biosynthesis transcriptional activator notL' [Paramyrothecium foliicola]